jgi:hypothetical protein
MMADLTQIDQISEDEMIEALSDMPSTPTTDVVENKKVEDKPKSETIHLDNKVEANRVISLLQELISGKTLEISVKVKD